MTVAVVTTVQISRPKTPASGPADDAQVLAAYPMELRAANVGSELRLGGESIEGALPDAPELPSGGRVDEALGFGLPKFRLTSTSGRRPVAGPAETRCVRDRAR